MPPEHHDEQPESPKRPGSATPSAETPTVRRGTYQPGFARTFLDEINYPHNIHPALVPGVSVDDQKYRFGVDRLVAGVAGALIVGFIAWGILSTETLTAASSAALTWTMGNMGWAFSILATALPLYLLYLAVSRYGRIPLGLDDDKPAYSTPSWAAMLFAAGIGIGIIFFGPFEPMTYFLSPRPGSVEPAAQEAMKLASAQAALHWGLNAWAIYALVGLAVAYTSYRRGRVPLMSSVFAPFFRDGKTDNLAGRIIDILAIIATLFGTAASLGIGALQIGRGVQIFTGWNTAGNTAALLIISVLTAGFIASAVSGVARGIRVLSNINMVLAIVLALFFFVVGPTAFLLNFIPSVFVTYFAELPTMLTASMADGPEMQEFLSSWTVFYWAWWVSWAPFVGVFVAKISRGRTIRQFVFGVLFIPSTIVVLAFTVLGGTAIRAQVDELAIAPDGTIDSLPAPEEIFFVVLDTLPSAGFMAAVVVLMLAIFFITTADSASIVASQMSQRGDPDPRKLITVFWGLCMAGIAIVMLLVGGESALTGLQNLITVTALPFTLIMFFMVFALHKDLRSDPLILRDQYRHWALDKAVRHGIDEHGDVFMIPVERASGDQEKWATAPDFDSTAPEYTQWYQRTDEDGNPLDYDYETGTYTGEVAASQSEKTEKAERSEQPRRSGPGASSDQDGDEPSR
ncbi:BCCT family transporter [Kocuria coralli]|uniref:BCCT family transporter n=1 Tax=Kocuria coralli TaxID=1461025 RepID=A0A5J5L0I4_9MICC|nr:BCCT family transporter [Kocuria coralli]KAA9395343.1 BCCT family transporter [Kocuria coralli]